jgi:O-antigen ligase
MIIKKEKLFYSLYTLFYFFWGIYIITIIVYGNREETLFIPNAVFVLLAITQVLIILFRKKLTITWELFIYFPFLILLIIGLFYAQNQIYALSVTRTFGLLYLLLILVYKTSDSRKIIHQLIVLFGIASLCVTLYAVNLYGVNHIFNSIIMGRRLGFEFGNPNGLGYFLSVGFIILLYLYLNNQKPILKTITLISCLTVFLLIIATMSRRALLISLFGMATLIVYNKVSLGKKMFRILIIMAMLVVVISSPVLGIYLERTSSAIYLFDDPSQSIQPDINRLELIETGFELSTRSPIWGHGTGSFRFLIVSSYYFFDETSSHNNFIEMAVNHGVLGLFFYYAPMLYLLVKIFKKIKMDFDPLGGLLLTLLLSELLIVSSMALNYTNKISTIIIALCLAYSSTNIFHKTKCAKNHNVLRKQTHAIHRNPVEIS